MKASCESNCVVKQLRPSVNTPEVLQMARDCLREKQNPYKVSSHPQPRLLDYFEDRQQFYLVQEYISGLTLQRESALAHLAKQGSSNS